MFDKNKYFLEHGAGALLMKEKEIEQEKNAKITRSNKNNDHIFTENNNSYDPVYSHLVDEKSTNFTSKVKDINDAYITDRNATIIGVAVAGVFAILLIAIFCILGIIQ